MPEHLVRTQTVLEECQQHLQSAEAAGSPIESYLTEHILVVLCGDVQRALYTIADKRAQRSSDLALHIFVSEASVKLLRSVQKNEIAAFIGFFGPAYKEAFNNLLDERDITTYNNAVRQRHQVAHLGGGTMTFRELPDAIAAANKILDSAQAALTL